MTACDERGDKWSDEVRTRLNDRRSSHDLHTADARYHEECRKKFMRFKKAKLDEYSDDAFQELLQAIEDDPKRMWNSIEMERTYKEINGIRKSRKSLVNGVLTHFGDIMVHLTSPGLADIVGLRKHTASIIRLQEDDNEVAKNEEKMIDRVAKKILSEVRVTNSDRTLYRKRINIDIALEDVRPTLRQLLSYISPYLSLCSLPSIMIGNMVTAQVLGRTTHLLTSLSIFIRKKKQIEHLYDYGVVSSYETKLFRPSIFNYITLLSANYLRLKNN